MYNKYYLLTYSLTYLLTLKTDEASFVRSSVIQCLIVLCHWETDRYTERHTRAITIPYSTRYTEYSSRKKIAQV